MRYVPAVLVLAGCGRVAFDQIGDVHDWSAPRIVVIGTNPTQADSDVDTSLAILGSLVTRVPDPVQIDPLTLDEADLVVIEALTTLHAPAEGAALSHWVGAGGSLLVFSGFAMDGSDADFDNRLLSGLDIQLSLPLIDGTIMQFGVHPTTHGIAGLPYLGGYGVVAPDPAVATLDGTVVGVAAHRILGRVFVWGDEWVTLDSQWSANPDVATFFAQVTAWLDHAS